MCAIADQPDARPQVDGVRDPVSPVGDEDDAATRGCGGMVDRSLYCGGIVGYTIGRSSVGAALQICGVGVGWTLGEDGLSEQCRRAVTKNRVVARRDRMVRLS